MKMYILSKESVPTGFAVLAADGPTVDPLG